MKTSILLDHGPAATGGWVVRALLRIEGEPPAAARRTPLSLCLVLDRSGSMAGPKLDAARRAAVHVVRGLAPEDRVSVVAYDDSVLTVSPVVAAEQAASVIGRIEAIEPGGNTNLSGGWLRARELVMGARIDGGVNRVLLLTDGLANAGITDPAQLAALCASAREQGVTTTTIGFGADYDEHLLRAMADAGGGNTYYIERPDQAPAVFGAELEGLLGVCAQNITVVFEPAPAAQLSVAHHSYPCTQSPGKLSFELGDLYANLPKPLLLEVLVEDAPGATEIAIGTITVSGTVLRNDGSVATETIVLPIKLDATRGAHAEPDIQREVLLVEAAKAREQALEEQRMGNTAAASSHLSAMAARISAAAPFDMDLMAEADDLASVAESWDNSPAAAPPPEDLKYLYQKAHDTRRGRTSVSQNITRKKP